MASENAKAAAKQVIKSLRNSTKVNMGEILREQGYSESVALHPDNVTNTKSFQGIITPVLEQYKAEEQRILKAMAAKDISAEKYEVLVNASDKIRKQVQLLSGGPTERPEILDPTTSLAGIPGMEELRQRHLDEIRAAIAKQHGK